jgi:hypothetical protein
MGLIASFNGDISVLGDFRCRTFTPPALSITDAAIAAAAGIKATKIQKPRLLRYAQSGTAAAVTIPIYVCNGATATILSLKAGSIAPNIGVSTVTVDLKKNGTTILSAVITLDNANVARVLEAATLASTSLVADDFLELVIVATVGGGTLATGLYVQLEIHEDQ